MVEGNKKYHRFKKGLFVVFSLFMVICFFPHKADAATINLFSDKEVLSIGDEFTLDVKIDTENIGINAAQATLQFSQDLVAAENFDKTNSAFNFWLAEPDINNNNGTISFIAGSSSGFSGKSLHLLRVKFKVKGSGTISLTLNDAAVTASDGSGTNVLSATKGLEIKSLSKSEVVPIKPQIINAEPEVAKNAPVKPSVLIPLYPNSEKWYNVSSNFVASWDLPRDVVGVGVILNKIPTTVPGESAGLFNNKNFSALDNGISYLHVRFRNNIGWGPTNHYRIAIDTLPPPLFKVEVLSDDPSDPNPLIKFESKDQISKIDYYTIKIDGLQEIKTANSNYNLPNLPPGKHSIKVFSQDQAGNITEGSAEADILPINSPKIVFSSKKVYTDENNIAINGLSLPNIDILLNIRDDKGQILYQTETKSSPDGFWSSSIEYLLKIGTYKIEVISRDERGALSLPVFSDNVRLAERPILTVFGLGLTYKLFIVVLIFLLAFVFLIGFLTQRISTEKRRKRILIAQRDVNSEMTNIKKDIEKIISYHKPEKDGKVDEDSETKVDFMLQKIDKNIKDNQNYILENIEEIE